MSENATKRLPVTKTTKQLVDEAKDDGTTYDYWVRKQLGEVNQ